MMQLVYKQLYYWMSEPKQQIKLFDNQVSGKSAKFTDADGTNIFKKLSQKQYDFYSYMETLPINSSQYKLRPFIPKFRGKKSLYTLNVTSNPEDTSKKGQWMSHIAARNQTEALSVSQFIALENLSMGYIHPCMMDIKLGKKKASKKSNKKFENSTTNSHHFRINGMSNLYVQEKQPHFISKYYFQKTSQQQIQTHLSFFFYDGKSLDLKLIKKCIDQTKQIILALQCFKGGSFNSASLLICYDAYDHNKFAVKIIDFDQFYPDGSQQSSDQNIIIGLKYIVWYLNNIVHRYEDHQEDIKNKKLKIFQNFELIPEQKIKQFVDKLPQTRKQLQKMSQPDPVDQVVDA